MLPADAPSDCLKEVEETRESKMIIAFSPAKQAQVYPLRLDLCSVSASLAEVDRFFRICGSAGIETSPTPDWSSQAAWVLTFVLHVALSELTCNIFVSNIVSSTI